MNSVISNQNLTHRLAIPKSKHPCCSKNCNLKPHNYSNACLTNLQNKTFKTVMNNLNTQNNQTNLKNNQNNNLTTNSNESNSTSKKKGNFKINKDNESFLVNSSLFKTSLLAKRNLYNEKLKNEALSKFSKGSHNPINVNYLKTKNDNINVRNILAFKERSRCYNSSVKSSSNKNFSTNKKTGITEILHDDLFTEEEMNRKESVFNTLDLMNITKKNNNLIFQSSHKKIRGSRSKKASRNFSRQNCYFEENNEVKGNILRATNNVKENISSTQTFEKKGNSIIINNNNNYYINQINDKTKQDLKIVEGGNFEFCNNYYNTAQKKTRSNEKIDNINESFSNTTTKKKNPFIANLDLEYDNQNELREKFCFKKLQSFKDWQYYGKDFKKQLFVDQQIHRRTKISQMFQNEFNKISEKMRSKMVDWIIEVLFNYKTSENTFFLTIELMDAYITNNSSKVITPSDLHLIGCTCMFLASKIHDIRPLKLKIVHEKISHEKLQISEIKEQELEILRTLKFHVNLPTILDYSNIYCFELFNCLNSWKFEKELLSCDTNCSICSKIANCNEETIKENEKNNFNLINKIINPSNYKYDISFIHLFKSVLIYIQKLICHEYKLMCEYPSVLASGSIIVTFKICEQITSCSYLNSGIIDFLENISEISNYELILISQNILKFSQEFDEQHKELENLKKIHVSEITSFIVAKED